MERNSAGPPPAINRLQQALVVAALAGLALFGGISRGATRFYTWPWVFYGELLLLAPLGLLAMELLLRPRERLARPACLALLAVAAAVALSTGLSLQPRFSGEAALFIWGGLAVAALVARHLGPISHETADPATLRRTVRLIAALLALPLLSSALLWTGDILTVSETKGWTTIPSWLFKLRNPHPAGHSNYTGGQALLALPWLATVAWQERGRWRLLWSGAAAVGVVILFSTGSRGATLGAVVILTLAAAHAVLGRSLPRRRLLLLAAGVLAAGTLLLATNPRLRGMFSQPAASYVPQEGDVQRLGMLQAGLLLGATRPWTGHGAGMTPFLYPTVRAQLTGGVETSFQLHNAPLQWWVDHGLVGLAAAAGLGLVALTGARNWRQRAPGAPLRSQALASAVTLAGYCAFALTDYQLSVVAITATLGMHLGVLLAGLPPVGPARAHRLSRTSGWFLLAAAAAALVVLVPNWRARQLFWSAWEIRDNNALVEQLRAAADAAPWSPHYRNHLAFRLASTAADAPARAITRSELERSLALDPAQEPVEASLGWLWLPDNPGRAETHFRAAIALLPERATVYLGLALTRLAASDESAAVNALSTACVVDPAFVTSPLWNQDPLARLRDSVVRETDQQYARVLGHAATPVWRKPALQYARAFVRWWTSGVSPDAADLSGASPDQQAFFNALLVPSLAGPASAKRLPPALLALAVACQATGNAADILALQPQIPAPAREGALARLHDRPAAQLADLLRSPAPNGQGLLRLQIERGHYAIMHRNLDGPGYVDPAPQLSDPYTETFVGFLFPPRGLAPGLAVLDLLPPPREGPDSQ